MQYPAHKIAYGFDPLTHAYIGEVMAYIDPLASGDAEAVYTLPANAVWEAPPDEPLPEFMRYGRLNECWQILADSEAFGKEVERRRAQADAQISVCDDTVLLLTEDVAIDPENVQLLATLKAAKLQALTWKRYRLELARMAANVNTLDVSALVWPDCPAA